MKGHERYKDVPPYRCSVCGNRREAEQMEHIRQKIEHDPDVGALHINRGICKLCAGKEPQQTIMFTGSTRVGELPVHFWQELICLIDGKMTAGKLQKKTVANLGTVQDTLRYFHRVGIVRRYRIGREIPYELTEEGKELQRHVRSALNSIDDIGAARESKLKERLPRGGRLWL